MSQTMELHSGSQQVSFFVTVAAAHERSPTQGYFSSTMAGNDLNLRMALQRSEETFTKRSSEFEKRR